MRLIEKAVAHYQAQEPKSLHIPEWEVTLYCREPTMAQKASWQQRSKDGDYTDYMCMAIIDCCFLDDGSKAFAVGDKAELVRIGNKIVERIGLWVLGADAETEEDREKN